MGNGVINIRVDKNLKKASEAVFNEIGVSMTTGITMYLKKVVKSQSIPFSLVVEEPNKATLEAFKEADDIMSGKVKAKRYKSVTELRKELKVWNMI